MRWKFSRDENSMYTCLWCFHVRTGTFLLGLISLLLQVAVLALIMVAFIHPDVIPTWVSSFVAPRANRNADRMRTDIMSTNNGMMMSDIERSALMENRGMQGPSKNPDGEMIVNGERDATKEENDGGVQEVQDTFNGMMSNKLNEEDLGRAGMKKEQNIESDLWNNFDPKMSHMQRDSSLPMFVIGDTAGLETSTVRSMELDSDDKFLLVVMLIGCIAASALLMNGVIKGRPGHMMPYMGLQVFDFCISSLTVFSCFSYAPDIKRWIAAQPDSLPVKSFLMAMDSDRLMLALIMMSVLILVVKAYFMAVVASCYKYLTQAQHEAVHRRRRSTEDDMHNPEDAELLLPPKYEDIVDEPNLERQSEPAPPPYQAA